MRHFKTLALHSTATFALISLLSASAQAQVSVTEDTSEQIRTSTAADDGTADDVEVSADATVTIDESRSGVILDSDNQLILSGTVRSDDINDVTGVELQGGAERSFIHSGTIELVEDFTAENTDDDPFTDTPFAVGEGRTGILISGASPFQGNIELDSTSFRDDGQRRGFAGDLSDAGREDLTAQDLLQAGPTLSVSGNVSQGIFLSDVFELSVDADGNAILDDDGNEIYTLILARVRRLRT